MKTFRIALLALLGLTAMTTVTSCGEPDDEITEASYKRNFSPTDVKANVRNRTNVELSWTLGYGVTAYNIEVYANDSLTFAGTPVKTIQVTPEQMPYLVTGLEGETQYSFRIQAVDGNDSRNSKWQGAYAKTETEQIFQEPTEADVKATSVTLRWPAGEQAATITLSPGDIVYSITAADIAAGAATITGLQPETSYSATMRRDNGKTRGKVSFKTGVELAETDILVNEGDDLGAAIKSAPEGYRLVLMPGEYNISAAEDASYANGSVTISRKLAIKGLRPGEKPVIKGRIKVEATFELDQVILDGSGTDGGQAFDFTGETDVHHLYVTNSEVKNFTKGFFYINKAVKVTNINIEGCVISNIECSGGDFFDSRAGGYEKFTFTNNTVYNCAAKRDVVRMDDASGSITATPVITFDHNTFFNVGNGDANYRFFYVRFAGNTITFTNNIVVGFNNKRGFANQSSTDQNPTLEGNVYFNTKNLLSLADGNSEKVSWFDESGTELDPQFADPDNGDFTVTNLNVADLKAGDPRWLK